MAVKDNMVKSPPKGAVRFSLSLSKEQKKAKTEILKTTESLGEINLEYSYDESRV